MSGSWRRGPKDLAEGLVALLGAFLVWALVRTLVLNTFYVQGAYYLDAGWFANLAFRSDWLLTAPSGHPWAQASYFRHHLALFFMPLNGISHVIGSDHVGFFACWYGAIHVFSFLVGYSVFRSGLRDCRVAPGVASPLAALAGFLFAFNGVAIAALLYPHPEVLMSFAIVAMLWALVRERLWLASAMGVLALMVRTDGGFHVAIFCGAAAFGAWVDARFDSHAAGVRRLLGIAAAAFLFSCLAYGFQAKFFPGGAQFRNIYAGSDFFGHVSARLLTERIGLHLFERPYLFAGWLGCLAAFAATRRWIFLAGVLAALPWYLANLVALSDAAGGFFSYYPFPFIVLLLWPLIHAQPGAKGSVSLLAITLLALMLSVAGALGPGGHARIVELATAQQLPAGQAERLQSTLDRLVAGVPPERVRFDGAVMSLVARQAARRTLFGPKHGMSGVETVIYFEQYMDTTAIEAAFAGREGLWRCALPGSPLRLLSLSVQDTRLAEQTGLSCRSVR